MRILLTFLAFALALSCLAHVVVAALQAALLALRQPLIVPLDQYAHLSKSAWYKHNNSIDIFLPYTQGKHAMKLKTIYKIMATLVTLGSSVSYALPTSGAYVTDKTQKFTNNFTQRIINQINGILCIGTQTNYSDFTNQGAYLAQVDMNACGMGDNEDTVTPSLTQVVVDPTNASQTQTVKFWFDGVEVGQGSQGFIEVKVVASSTPTANNPYGEFTFNYIAYGYDNNGVVDKTNVIFKGFIISELNSTTGVVNLKYYDNSLGNEVVAMNFVDSGSNSGYGRLSLQKTQENMTASIAFNIAFLENLVNNPAIQTQGHLIKK